MGAKIINLAVIVAGGTMVADMVANATGTAALFNGVGGLWSTSINGLLGKTATAK